MTTPNQAAIAAGVRAGRAALQAYSAFASMGVPDEALTVFVTDILAAAIPVQFPAPPNPAQPK
jgi:hypothetical protein